MAISVPAPHARLPRADRPPTLGRLPVRSPFSGRCNALWMLVQQGGLSMRALTDDIQRHASSRTLVQSASRELSVFFSCKSGTYCRPGHWTQPDMTKDRRLGERKESSKKLVFPRGPATQSDSQIRLGGPGGKVLRTIPVLQVGDTAN